MRPLRALLIKEAFLRQIAEVGGVLLAHRIDARSLVQNRTTVLTLEEVRISRGLATEIFSVSALKGGRSGGGSEPPSGRLRDQAPRSSP